MDVLEPRDFCFTGTLGSAGARIEARGPNRFAIALGEAPNHPEWANKLNFEINRPARNVALELDVSFANGGKPSFNEYPQAYSVDNSDWVPVDWAHGRTVSTAEDLLRLPPLSWNRLVVGTQTPLSYEHLMARVETWRRSPHVACETLGTTTTGRHIVRLTLADAQGAPMRKRWVHYITHQHPGEFNAQWRMIGMIDWLLSDHAAAADMRRRMVFHFVPCMSPDGPTHGWYRVNATGHDMNRTYRSEGADARHQPPEAYCVQRDFEAHMRSDAPIVTTWSMHTWGGLVDPILTPGPEFGTRLGAWEQFRDVLAQCDPEGLVKPLRNRCDEDIPLAKATTWSAGPHRQFGVTGVLCEGASHFDRQRNEASGVALARALGAFYDGLRDA